MKNKYVDNIVSISHIQSIKIFCFAIVFGLWTLFKDQLLKILRSTKNDWSDIDHPPLCLVDSSIGQHSYMKIKGKGIKLHYLDAGDKNKPAIVLLHGFPDCWIGWFHQLAVLSKHFRVIALDLKGFGDSDKPQSRRAYRLEVLLEEITIFITSLGVNRCSIIGHDLGAFLGWYLVHLNPDLISKFVAISCIHPNIYWEELPYKSIFNYNWIQLCQLPILPEMILLKDNLSIIDKCFKHLKIRDQNEYIDAYKYTFSRSEDWTGALNYYRNLPFCRLEDETLREIRVPCLLITGSADTSVTLESIVRSTEFIQRYNLKMIEDANHYPHQEKPDEVNKVLLEFLLDPPLVRKKDNSNTGIISKMMESVTRRVKTSSEVLATIRSNGFVINY